MNHQVQEDAIQGGVNIKDASIQNAIKRIQFSQLELSDMDWDTSIINGYHLSIFGGEMATKDSSHGKIWYADPTNIDSGSFNMLPALHFLSKALLTARKIVKIRSDKLGTVDSADASV